MTEPEPFYIAQTAEKMTGDERYSWFARRTAEAKHEGAKWCRMSVDDADRPTMCLFEAWRERPADEGEPRWQFTHVLHTDDSGPEDGAA